MHTTDFNGCCGARIWILDDYLYTAASVNSLKSMLRKQADTDLGCYSIAMMILNTEQKNKYEKCLLSFGFKKAWRRGIVNVNTGKGLYGYYLNLNNYKLKKKRKPVFNRSRT